MNLRAGLFGSIVAVILLPIVTLTSAAPLPARRVGTPISALVNTVLPVPRSHNAPHLNLAGFSPVHLGEPSHNILSIAGVDSQPEGREANNVVLIRRTSIKEKFRRLGQKIKAGFKKVGQKIKAGFQKAGQKIKAGFQKFGEKAKAGFKKLGHFIKTTGAKIAKVGLKIWSTVQKVASKVVQFIPVIGKPLSKVMDGLGTAANKASDAIHVKIGGKLGKSMDRMSKAQKIVGYIPRGYQERDLDEFNERDLYEINMLLDAREHHDELVYDREWQDWEGFTI